jgi:hypothetical protein
MGKIYHYTTKEKATQILFSGFLKVSEWERINTNSRPALWLSLNSTWEHTATKQYLDKMSGERIQMTPEMQMEKFGCVRFVLSFPNKRYFEWSKYGKISGTGKDEIKMMEIAGRNCGANPNHWYASFDNIPISEVLEIEILKEGQWIEWDSNEIEFLIGLQNVMMS